MPIHEVARIAVQFLLSWIAFWYATSGLLVPVLPGYYQVTVPPLVGFLLAIVFIYQAYSLRRFFRFLVIAFIAAAALYVPIIGTILLSDTLPGRSSLSPPFALAALVNALALLIGYYFVYISNRSESGPDES